HRSSRRRDPGRAHKAGGLMSGPDVAWYVAVAAVLFGIGALGVLIRRNTLVVLLSLELMLNAGNLALIALARHWHNGAGQICALLDLQSHDPQARTELTTAWTWLQSGNFHAGLQLLVDPLSTVMMLIVSGVGGLIVLYSIGYMDGDDEERRYFAYISFFVFSMLLLVEGGNLLMLLIGWGLVGLSSYLLIGFWHERPSAVQAAKKAFVMNAFGDATMALAFFILIAHTNSLSFGTLNVPHLSSTATNLV